MNQPIATTNFGQLFYLLNSQSEEAIQQMGQTINWDSIEVVPRQMGDDSNNPRTMGSWEEAELWGPMEILLLHETPARVRRLLLPIALVKSPEQLPLPKHYEITEAKLRALRIAVRNVDDDSIQVIAKTLEAHQVGKAYALCVEQLGRFCEVPTTSAQSKQCLNVLKTLDEQLRSRTEGRTLLSSEERLERLKHLLLEKCLMEADLLDNREQWAGYWASEVKECTAENLWLAIEHFASTKLLNLIWQRQPEKYGDLATDDSSMRRSKGMRRYPIVTKTWQKLSGLLAQIERTTLDINKNKNWKQRTRETERMERLIQVRAQQYMQLALWSIENLILPEAVDVSMYHPLLEAIVAGKDLPQVESCEQQLLKALQDNRTPVVGSELKKAFAWGKECWFVTRLTQAKAQQQGIHGLMTELATVMLGEHEQRQAKLDLLAQHWDELQEMNQLGGSQTSVTTFAARANLDGKEQSNLELKIRYYQDQKAGLLKQNSPLRL